MRRGYARIPWRILPTFISFFHRLNILSIHSNGLSKVFPFRIKIVDQSLFPVTMPFLQLFLTMDTIIQTVKHLVIHQFFDIILGSESLIDVQFMLCYPSSQVSRNTSIQCGVMLIGQYVDDSLKHCVQEIAGQARDEEQRACD